MNYMLLIVEPLGQRGERTQAEGQALYARMLDYANDLTQRGLLLSHGSLLDQDQGQRLQKRQGQTRTLDGPFAETKEMVGGYFLLDVADREQALTLAAQCPAAEWATVEVRPMGPCWVRNKAD